MTFLKSIFIVMVLDNDRDREIFTFFFFVKNVPKNPHDVPCFWYNRNALMNCARSLTSFVPGRSPATPFRPPAHPPPPTRPKAPFDRKDEMVSEFRRWAGYAPRPVQVPFGGHAPGAKAFPVDDPPEVADRLVAPVGPAAVGGGAGGKRQSRARTRADVEASAAPDENGQDDRVQTRRRALSCARSHTPTRARSVSARLMACDGGGRTAKRSKSSGPPARETRRRSQQLSACGAGEQTAENRVPWGAGPRVGGARERAHAWASTYLENGKLNGFGGGGDGGGGGGTGRPRKPDGVSGDGARSVRSRARARRGRVAGGGCRGTHTSTRKPAKDTGRNVRGNRAGRKKSRRSAGPNPSRRGGAGGDGDGDGTEVVRCLDYDAAKQPTRRRRLGAAGQEDITWDVLHDEDYPEFAPRPGAGAGRQGERGYRSPFDGAQEDARTSRVVEMLVSLEKAVVDVCKVRRDGLALVWCQT